MEPARLPNRFRSLPLFFQRATLLFLRPALRFFVRFEVRGVEHLSSVTDGAVFASNHSGFLDSGLMPAALPNRLLPLFYTVRERTFYDSTKALEKALFGVFINRAWGAYQVFVGTGDYAASLPYPLALLAAGQSVIIYPEGHVTRDGELQRARGGAAYLAWKSGKPVVPVRITGVWGLSIADALLRRKKVTLTFGAPIDSATLFQGIPEPRRDGERDDFRTAAERVMDAIRML